MSNQFVAHLVLRGGVANVTASRVALDKNKRFISIKSISTPSASLEHETVIPIRSLHSMTLDMPDNSYCKYIASAVGFAIGMSTGATVGSNGGSTSVTASTATIVGGLSAAGIFTLCNTRKAMLTLRTPKEDYTYSVKADQKEQSIRTFNALKESL